VANYPHLCDDWDDPMVKLVQAQYEAKFSCPSNAARNLLSHCRDRDSREKFYAGLRALYKSKKSAKEDEGVGAPDPEEEREFNLENELRSFTEDEEDDMMAGEVAQP
jgi:hypothetical protein